MSLKAQLDGLLGAATAKGEVPGIVAMVTDRKGNTYEGAFGKRSLTGDAPMTTDTVGLIASMTKAITSTAAMQLVEQGRLDLDSPAGTWLPQLGQVHVLEGFDAAGQPRTRAPKRSVTLRHLLTHTSGYSYEFLSTEIQQYHAAKKLPTLFTCERAALDTPLLFDPGERWQYGIGIDWAGQLVEKISGQKLGAYLKQHILDPLGMSDTGFARTPSMQARLAKVHARLEDGTLVPIDLELPQEPGFQMGGGGLYSTVGDYLKFIRMVLNGGESSGGGRILKAETLAQMSRNQIGPLEVPSLKSADKTLTNDLVLPPDNPHGWGLAWIINSKPLPTGRPGGALSWAGLTNSYYFIDPASGIGGAMLMQVLPFADIKAMPLYYAFEYLVYQNR